MDKEQDCNLINEKHYVCLFARINYKTKITVVLVLVFANRKDRPYSNQFVENCVIRRVSNKITLQSKRPPLKIIFASKQSTFPLPKLSPLAFQQEARKLDHTSSSRRNLPNFQKGHIL